MKEGNLRVNYRRGEKRKPINFAYDLSIAEREKNVFAVFWVIDRRRLDWGCRRKLSTMWLLVIDRWAEGWEATVNCRPQTMLGGIFRAVEVEPGANRVQFVYKPRWFLPFATWSPLLLIAAWQCRRMLHSPKQLLVAA